MRTVHYLTLAASIGCIALLYVWGRTTPPPKTDIRPDMPAGTVATHVHTTVSIDSLLQAARKTVAVHALEQIDTVEKEIAAVADSSAMAPAITRLARIWQEHQQFPVAAYYYAQAAKLEKSEKSLNFAGQFFLQLIQHTHSHDMQVWVAQQAIDCFRQSLLINPDNDTTKLALAAGYIEGTGETMEGVQMLLGITRETPEHIPANLMLGRLAVQSGQLDKAIERFETVLSQEPANTEALYFMAEAYKGKGNKEKAIELFEACKKIVNKPEFTREIDQYINSFK